MYILKAKNKNDYDRWLHYWESYRGDKIFFHPDYVQLYADVKTEACCAIMDTFRGVVIYAFLLRDLTKEPYYDSSLGQIYDIITPYGYGGPIIYKENDHLLMMQFYDKFSHWAIEHNVVSEFIRFHLKTDIKQEYYGCSEYCRTNYILDLRVDIEQIWEQFKSSARQSVRRALKNDVETEIDEVGENWSAFVSIYYQTMDRLGADPFYYFSEDYFNAIREKLCGHYVLAHAKYQGMIVSSELLLLSGNTMYFFLGGTIQPYFKYSPNHLLKYAIIQWGRLHGFCSYVLGGGYSTNDSLSRFKQTFSPNGAFPFFTGKTIFKPRLYETLVQLAKNNVKDVSSKDSFFPLYRI